MTDQFHPRALFRPFSEQPSAVFTPSLAKVDLASALVFLDTNVLLAPYGTSSQALDEIGRVYTQLRQQDRLLVPGQVAREFARNRPRLLADLHKVVSDARSTALSYKYKAPPVLHGLPEHARAVEEQQKIGEALKAFNIAVTKLADRVASWRDTDPVLDVYRGLFREENVPELEIEAEVVETIRKARYDAGLPPGYKDGAKADGGGGDLIIWLTVLQVAAAQGKDAILVTEEAKPDWFHRSNGSPLYVRYELTAEFAEATSGRSFALMTLPGLLQNFGVRAAIVEEIETQEKSGWWQAPSAAADLEGQAFERLIEVVGVEAISVNETQFPDLTISLGDTRIGVEFKLVLDAPIRRAQESISQAAHVYKQGEFSEVIILLLARSDKAANALRNWVAEESSLGEGIGLVVTYLGADGAMRTVVNQSGHPKIKDAFPIRAGRLDKSKMAG